MKILLDTNFLMAPGSLKLDVYSMLEAKYPQAKLYVLQESIDELKTIIKREKGKMAKEADLALQILGTRKVNIVPKDPIKTKTFKSVDKIIVETAKQRNFVVCTQDKALKQELRENQVPLIFLRQKKLLSDVEG